MQAESRFSRSAHCCVRSRARSRNSSRSACFKGLGRRPSRGVGPALYRTVFPTAQLGRGLGISALVVASSLSAGPTIGGLILAIAPWPWLFAINVPLGIIDTIMAVRILPHQQTVGGRFDVPSAVYSAMAIGLLVVGLDGFAHRGTPVEIAFSLGLSVAAAIAFILRQRTAAHPMLPLAIFRIRRFSLAAATSLCSFVAQGLAFVSLPFLFQGPLGYSAFASGLLITPWPVKHRICCSHCRPARGSLPAEYPVHRGPSPQRRRTSITCALAAASDERRHRLARSRVRAWVWFLPIAQQPRTARQRTARTQRQCFGGAIDRTRDRSNARRRIRRHRPCIRWCRHRGRRFRRRGAHCDRFIAVARDCGSGPRRDR